jgi:hypothetical protein
MKIILTLELAVHGDITDATVLDWIMEHNGIPGVFVPPGYDSDDDPGWLIEVKTITGEIGK